MPIDTDAGDLGRLDSAIEKVEFKLTVLAAEEATVQALLQRTGTPPQRRKVYFYDTADLALYNADLVLRARVTDGDEDDSTVKLRPVDLADLDAGWRQIGGIRVELDVVGDKQVPSAKLDGTPDRGEIEQVEAGHRALGSLFSAKQERLIASCAPRAIALDDLEVLGPVDARKWELENPDGFPHSLGVEEWALPDATRFIELSFKVGPNEAKDAQTAFRALLTGLDIDLAGDQQPKTPRVLKFFAGRRK
jgi:hypothetical protein